MDFKELSQFCKTDIQREAFKLFIKYGSVRMAAKESGKSRSTLRSQFKLVQGYAATKGYAPQCGISHPLSNSQIYTLDKVSDMRTNSDGKPIWYKYSLDKEKELELIQLMIEELKADLPVYKPSKCETNGLQNADLLNCYILTDYHLGMLAWGDESGDDWDVKVAEDLLVKWFAEAIKQSPDAESCLLSQLGDFLHYDGMESVTPTSGHILDADSRFQKVVRVAIRVLRRVIDMLCAKYKTVNIIMATGNHDLASSVWLREFFQHIYQDCENVNVDTNPDIYYCHEFGKTSLFFHHGHKKRVHNVSDVFAGKYRDVFGRTSQSYAHLGHFHHNEMKENNLMIVEQHRTLAAKDAHASQGGYLSGRDAKVITYHAEHGEVGRITINVNMVK